MHKLFNNELTLIYGPSGSGKTTFLLSEIVKLISKNKKVVFIDTQNSFSVERLKQLDKEADLNNVFLFKIKNFNEQNKLIRKLNKILEASKASLVVIDTMGYYYRFALRKDHSFANRIMSSMLSILKDITKRYSLPVLISSQVYDNIDKSGVNVVGGDMIFNWCERVIELQKNGKRKFIVRKPEQQEFFFKIEEDKIIKCS